MPFTSAVSMFGAIIIAMGISVHFVSILMKREPPSFGIIMSGILITMVGLLTELLVLNYIQYGLIITGLAFLTYRSLKN